MMHHINSLKKLDNWTVLTIRRGFQLTRPFYSLNLTLKYKRTVLNGLLSTSNGTMTEGEVFFNQTRPDTRLGCGRTQIDVITLIVKRIPY